MRADPARMQAIRLAHAYGRPNVDAFLDEVDADQYEELCAYHESRPPLDWDAANLLTARVAFAAMQPHVPKPIDERNLKVRLAGQFDEGVAATNDRNRMESLGIAARVRAELRAQRKREAANGRQND